MTNGIVTTVLPNLDSVHKIVKTLLNSPHYVFRGQRESQWLLEPTLARMVKRVKKHDELIKQHLQAFKFASRGRRGANPPDMKESNDWWALGQHHGLATPLLDWTTSPYVALFFAFTEEGSSDHSMIYALNTKRVEESTELDDIFDEKDTITLIRPQSDENSRLVAQAGLFTRSPIDVDIESWVSKRFKGESAKPVLLKAFVPKAERIECLKALNVMNINHATLFPDLYGAGKHATEVLRRKIGE